MKNSEKFLTAKERAEAFCRDNEITDAIELLNIRQVFNWLDLEAPAEKPLPCPFCTKGTLTMHTNVNVYSVWCVTCGYQSQQCRSEKAAISAHNRVARAAAKEKEADDANA